eukprot:NODE_1_length_95616_cov_0.657642.p14 type:complete len:414 gc:universal NODE_1_length_95616_cov_0.657642:85718-86959(+)
MEKCVGCGAILQTNLPGIAGYLPPIKEEKSCIVCERCHKLKNQNVMISEIPNFSESEIGIPKDSLHIVLFDLISYPKSICNYKFLNSKNIWLVGTKLDLLPKSVNCNIISENVNKDFPDVLGHSLVSSKTSQGMNQLINSLKRERRRLNLTHFSLLGFTNSGKTSLMNRLLKMSQLSSTKNRTGTDLTYSSYPGTTVGNIEFPLKKMAIFNNPTTGKLVDTPGMFDRDSNYNLLNHKEIFSLSQQKDSFNSKSFFVPKYYQKSLFIGGLARIDILDIKEDPLNLVWFGTNRLNPHFVNFDKADYFWNRYINKIIKNHGPPYDPSSLSPLRIVDEFTIEGDKKTTLKEIVLKNFGWFNIIKQCGSATIRLHSTLPKSLYTRHPFVKSYDYRGVYAKTHRFFGNHVLKSKRFVKL